MNDDIKLLPCPCCGKQNLDHNDYLHPDGVMRVRCAWCHCEAPESAWNRRAAVEADRQGRMLDAQATYKKWLGARADDPTLPHGLIRDAFLAGIEADRQGRPPIAWVTRNEDGDPAMLFFDRAEAETYCDDGADPEPLVLGADHFRDATKMMPSNEEIDDLWAAATKEYATRGGYTNDVARFFARDLLSRYTNLGDDPGKSSQTGQPAVCQECGGDGAGGLHEDDCSQNSSDLPAESAEPVAQELTRSSISVSCPHCGAGPYYYCAHPFRTGGGAAPVAQEPVSVTERWQDGDDSNMVSRVDTTAPVAAQARPCDHVYEARPIDGSRSATAPVEAVCRKCGERGGASLAPDVQRDEKRGAESAQDREDAERRLQILRDVLLISPGHPGHGDISREQRVLAGVAAEVQRASKGADHA